MHKEREKGFPDVANSAWCTVGLAVDVGVLIFVYKSGARTELLPERWQWPWPPADPAVGS